MNQMDNTEEKQTPKTQPPKCDDCKSLIGGGTFTKPHKNLTKTGGMNFSGQMGSADEEFYTCQVCGNEWTHETGNMGVGWFQYGKTSDD
jgi:hypothetical protein